MKIKHYILGAICFMAASCSALDLSPIDQYGINNYWNTEEQCGRFMTGLHARLKDKMETTMIMGELRGGTLNQESITSIGEAASHLEAVKNNLSQANPSITNWGDFYMDIYQINHAIDKISNACEFLSNDSRNTYLGQLYGMRAYYYFHLLRTYGGVPLCDKPDVLITGELDKLSKPRSSEQEIWEFVREDVDRSCECYKDLPYANYKNSKGYWNKAASQCLKAEVYLWGAKVKPIGASSVYASDVQGDMEAARDALLEIKDKYAFNPRFTDAFSVANKDANKETIFSARVVLGESTNHYSNFTYNVAIFTKFTDKEGKSIGNVLNIPSGALRYEYSQEFYDSFEEGDTRRDATLYQYYSRNNDGEILPAGRCLCKFLGDIKDGKHQYTNDVPIYRYSDVILMLAEIYNELGDQPGVKSMVDMVRHRAGSTLPAFIYTDKEAAEEAILHERKAEFVAEGKVWYDIRRMLGGREALDLVSGNELKLVWPIDSGVLTKDNLVEQNEGYR